MSLKNPFYISEFKCLTKINDIKVGMKVAI